MKKFALAVVATAFIAIGHGQVSAQTPDPEPIKPVPDELLIECGESDGRIDVDGDGIADDCVEFYVEALPPTTSAPATTTTTIALSSGPLPQTGSSVSPMLGMGALLLVGGGIIVVASRRRSTATAS